MTPDKIIQNQGVPRPDSIDNRLTQLFNEKGKPCQSADFATKVMQRITTQMRLRRWALGLALLLGSALAARAIPDLTSLAKFLVMDLSHALQGATKEVPVLLAPMADTHLLNSLVMMLAVTLTATMFARWLED